MRIARPFFTFLGITIGIYFACLWGEFIMDDWGYITLNPNITASSTPFRFWFSFNAGPDYWPLSYTFYWIFYRAFGENPFGYHLVNLVVHATNATLVFLLAQRFVPRMAFWAGLLFVVHPLHVQAVAWIIQFKTLLSTALVLATILTYLDGKKGISYALFALSLLAKSSGVFLPVALLLFVGKRKDLIPFFALALVGGLATLYSNHLNFTEDQATVFHMLWYQRPLLMVQNLMFYVSTFFVPRSQGYIYPYIVPGIFGWTLGLYTIALVAGVFLVGSIRWLREQSRFLVAYVLLLFPALGLVPIPNMKLSLVSDHWAYLPDAFLIVFVCAVLNQIPWTRVPQLTVAVLSIPLAYLSVQHARVFATEEGFWRRSIEINPDSPIPYYNLGTALDKQKRTEEAKGEYSRAVRIEPLHARAWYNLGRDHYLTGNLGDARECFLKTIELDPKIGAAYVAMAKVNLALLQKERAVEILKQGLVANPGDAEIEAELVKVQSSAGD